MIGGRNLKSSTSRRRSDNLAFDGELNANEYEQRRAANCALSDATRDAETMAPTAIPL